MFGFGVDLVACFGFWGLWVSRLYALVRCFGVLVQGWIVCFVGLRFSGYGLRLLG